MRLTGVYPPIATPFTPSGDLDPAALAANIARWNDTGLGGYVVAGSNGESALLEPEEVVALTRIARQTAAPDKLVIAGTGLQSTRATIDLSMAAAEAGADAVLVMTPSFFGAQVSDAAMIRHYEAIADASSVPVVAYNVPKFTHLNLSPETVARKIAATVQTLGADRFDLKYANGTLEHGKLLHSIELYGTVVAPMVHDLLARG